MSDMTLPEFIIATILTITYHKQIGEAIADIFVFCLIVAFIVAPFFNPALLWIEIPLIYLFWPRKKVTSDSKTDKPV